MSNLKHSLLWRRGAFVSALAFLLLVGLQSSRSEADSKAVTNAAPAVPAPVVAATPTNAAAPGAPAAPATTNQPVAAPVPVRICAGASVSFTDTNGNVWLSDQNFEGGEVYEKPDAQIENTKTPEIYRAERYSMTSFSYKLPNGKYTVKLHFAEIYEGITGPGERVFSFNVEGHEFKDFDVYAKAGGPNRAYVETVEVEVTDGKLDISFTPKVENPKISAIEILPKS